MVNFEEFQAYLRERISYWEKCEQEDYKNTMQEAAMRAKLMKVCYEDTLKKSNEVKL